MLKIIKILIITTLLIGCGITDMFTPIYKNYMINFEQEGTDQIYDLIYKSVQEYERNFGECNRPHILIVMRNWGFNCGGQLAAGCSYGDLINVGVHPTSECETMKVTLHELYHSCKGIYNHVVDGHNWTWDLEPIMQDFYRNGHCRIDENGLYENYVWE